MDLFEKKLDNMIYTLFYMYGCKYRVHQMEKLKLKCMNEINSHSGLKQELKDDTSIKYFIIQMALENIN